VENYLHDRPVSACPPSYFYRFRKFARRNKAALGLAVITCIALLTVFAALLAFGLQQRRLAREQLALANERSRFADEQAQSLTREKAIQEQTKSDLYRTLLGQAAALESAGEAGCRSKVWELLHAGAALQIPGADPQEVQDLILASLDDPLGLAPLPPTPPHVK